MVHVVGSVVVGRGLFHLLPPTLRALQTSEGVRCLLVWILREIELARRWIHQTDIPFSTRGLTRTDPEYVQVHDIRQRQRQRHGTCLAMPSVPSTNGGGFASIMLAHIQLTNQPPTRTSSPVRLLAGSVVASPAAQAGSHRTKEIPCVLLTLIVSKSDFTINFTFYAFPL